MLQLVKMQNFLKKIWVKVNLGNFLGNFKKFVKSRKNALIINVNKLYTQLQKNNQDPLKFFLNSATLVSLLF
jgi:hypothetical protein